MVTIWQDQYGPYFDSLDRMANSSETLAYTLGEVKPHFPVPAVAATVNWGNFILMHEALHSIFWTLYQRTNGDAA